MKIIEKQGEMKVPVKMFVNKKIMPNKITQEMLKKIACLEGVHSHVAVLPDIHYKYGETIPTGTVVASKDRIIPTIVSSDCGMGLMKTSLTEKKVNEHLDEIFKNIKSRISVKMRRKPTIKESDLKMIIKNGAEWACENYGINKKNLDNIENKGSFFKDKKVSELLKLVPKEAMKFGLIDLGVLGTGNHFLEMQAVDEIIDKKAAELFGLRKGQIVFMYHTDSRDFGYAINDKFSFLGKNKEGMNPIRKAMYNSYLAGGYKLGFLKNALYKANNIRKIVKRFFDWKLAEHKINKIEYSYVKAGTDIAEKYLNAKKIAYQYGFVNRLTHYYHIKEVLKEIFGNVEDSLLVDGTHDSIYKEDVDGEELLLHRSGATQALPKGKFKGHSVFSKTGQPVLNPGSMGSFSYICATYDGCKQTFYSANHGAGRTFDKPETRSRFKKQDVIDELKDKKIKLFRYGVGNIVEEAPSAYKDINSVIDAMRSNGIAQPVVKLKPLAVLKGS